MSTDSRVSADKSFLNLACGASFVRDGWVNLDYSPAGRDVVQADLLGRLPFADARFDLVYSSHFVEHIPQERVVPFFSECRRVLRPGGTLRIVVPDFEEMCTAYLHARSEGRQAQAAYMSMEILDQCVRKRPGGALSALYGKVERERDDALAEFIFRRCGEDLRRHVPAAAPVADGLPPPPLGIRVRRYLERRYIQAVCRLLPRAFREQNVSLAEVGETHAWLYDFDRLSELVLAAGFAEVKRMQFNSTREPLFPLVPLDATAAGEPRKGRQSMYLEAVAA